MKASKTILVVDDDPVVINYLVSNLNKINYRTYAAYEGLTAIKLAHEKKPDLIIMDYQMPSGSGMSVLRGLKSSDKTSSIPVIIITAFPLDKIKQQTQNMGHDYISKPFEKEDLLERIKKVLGETNGENI